MKTISMLAAVAGLALLAPGTPAAAQKKKAGLRIAPAVLTAAQSADAALTRGDATGAEPLVGQAEAAAVSDQERYIAAALRYRVEAAKQVATPTAASNQIGLAKALDTLIANPVTPAEDRGRYTYNRAQIAYFGRQYKAASDLFARAAQLGYQGPDQGLTAISARVDGGDAVGGTADLERAIAAQSGAGLPASPDYYRYAIARLTKAGAAPQAVTWMNRYLAAYPAPKTWYEVLTSYGLQDNATQKLDDRQKLSVFRLMRAANAVPGEYFYTQYADTAQRAGLTGEAQAVVKDGVSKGRLSAATPATKALLAKKASATSETALIAKATAASTAAPMVQAADTLLASGSDAKAVPLYRAALAKGGVDASSVNLHLGIALARSGNRAGAQAAFASVTDAPNAQIASFWQTWLSTSQR